MNKNVHIVILILSFIAFSCDEVIDNYTFPDVEKKLVLNGLFNTDSVFSVKVSQTYPSYDKDPLRYTYIENASVELYVNNEFFESLTQTYEGKYRSNSYIPETGNNYKVIINAPGFDTIQANSHIPSPVNITIDSLYPVIIEKKDYLACEISINDPEGDNYYYLTSRTIPDYYPSNISSNDTYNYWIDDDKIGQWSSFEEVVPEVFVFSDDNFNNSLFQFTIYASPLYNSHELLKVYFSLYSITEDLYNYLKTLNNQYHTNISNLADKTPVYNNIENGLGIFSGYSCKQDSFIFEGSETEILYYGYVNYNNKNFGIDEVKLYPDEQNNNFELNIGNINIYIDEETKKVKGKGVIISLILFTEAGHQIMAGNYEFNSLTNNEIQAGFVIINDHTEELLPDPISIQTGNVRIVSIYTNYDLNEEIIEIEFNFTLINGENISGDYEGPLSTLII